MHIVRIEPHDAPNYAERLLAIYRQLWITTMPSSELGITTPDIVEYFSNYNDRLTTWRDRILADPHRALWVLLTDTNEVVGFSIATREPGAYELDFVFILPEYQRKGYGMALSQKCLEWLGQDEPIVLGVAKHNTRAIDLYKKLGFQISPQPRSPKVLPSGKHIPWLEMICR